MLHNQKTKAMKVLYSKVFALQIFLILCLLINTDHAAAKFRVTSLPGFDGPLPFMLETGYIGLKNEELQVFYYFFESENNPKEDPLLLWLAGGPHCSGMSPILYEIVGTGFSYAVTPRANYSGDYMESHTVNNFLRKWLQHHPQYISNPLYIGGDSYTGFTLPVYFEQMAHGNDQRMEPFLNLKGYLLGNPSTDRSIDGNSQVPFAHGMGLISKEMFELLEESCHSEYHTVNSSNIECRSNILKFELLLEGIQTTHILEDYCDVVYLQGHESRRMKRRIMNESPNDLYPYEQLRAYSCRKESYKIAVYWMNDNKVREALHVHKESPREWIRCNIGFNYSYNIGSSVKYHAKLSARGFRSLIYSGDHDMIVPFIGTQKWIKSLNYSILDDWRTWIVDGQIAGFTRTYSNNMTYATIKGAGHTAPEYKPKESMLMFKRWISQEPL